MKNICFLDSVGFWGGGEKLMLEYALEFLNLGYRVWVAARSGGPLFERAAAAGLETVPAGISKISIVNPFSYSRLFRFFAAQSIDTIITTASRDMKIAGLAAKAAGVRRIVYLRGLARPVRNSWNNRLFFTKVLTHIIANSAETRKTVLRNMAGVVDEADVAVIYHGIDVRGFDERARTQPPSFPAREGTTVIGNAGRLTGQKGQLMLLKAARVLKERGARFTLVIAGTGEEEHRLKAAIESYRLGDDVRLLGFVENMEAFMRDIDILAHTSLWEGFGYALIEAMAAGKPVVAFDNSSNPEIVTHRRTGLLVRFPDTGELAAALEELINSNELRTTLGRNGRKEVEERFLRHDRALEIEGYLLGKSRPAGR